MKLLIQICSLITFFILNIYCINHSAKDFKNKKIIVARKETVKIKELDLTITNEGCGRKWMVTAEGHDAGEVPFCELIIKYKDLTTRAGSNFEPVRIGDAEIYIDKMNPWGVMEDSVPPGGCRLWVKKFKHQ